MTTCPKKKKELVYTVDENIGARVVRLENRFVGTLDWTTIHEERRTGVPAEAATTAAASSSTSNRAA